MKLAWRTFDLDFDRKTQIMGILNVTPDSFSEGGTYFDLDAAIEHGLAMVEDGADIIDIGGESTRPGSDPLPTEEELRRVIPVIEALASRVPIPLSIDTYKADVARRAFDAGASMVNDISGLRFDPDMPKVVASCDASVVIMHIKGTPQNMQQNPRYDALIPEIMDYLRCSIRLAVKFGVRDDRIIIDPGLGFGKTFDHNLEILRRLDEFTLLEKPVLIGPSRKAFIGKILGNARPADRLEGTAAAVAVSIMNGANMVRVHDVKEMVKVAKIADAVKRG
ncbi:MAG: dihydropteroate synthase [Thermodesulfovibrionales bacterium]|jgi:dihydropteroate synthase